MAPKKKNNPKKKSTTSKAPPAKDSTNAPPKKKVSPKKVSPKKSSSQLGTSPGKSLTKSQISKSSLGANDLLKPLTGFAIYTDENIQKPLQSVGKDIIKILSRNPLEAFIFWNIMPSTYDRALQHIGKDKDKVGLELLMEYTVEKGESKSQRIAIHPLSQNYFCRFLGPVQNLRVTLYAVSGGIYYLLFNSSSVDLPSNQFSLVWDEQWVNQEWIEKGYIVRSQRGEYILAEGIQEGDTIRVGDGLSGFMGSSGFSGSSGHLVSSEFRTSSQDHSSLRGGN